MCCLKASLAKQGSFVIGPIVNVSCFLLFRLPNLLIPDMIHDPYMVHPLFENYTTDSQISKGPNSIVSTMTRIYFSKL